MINILEKYSIFLNATKTKDWSYTLDVVGQFSLLIFIVLVILCLTYYFIKLSTKARIKKQDDDNLEIIESMSLSYQNYIQIIRVCEEYILVSVSKDKITFLTKLDNPEIKHQNIEHSNKILYSFEKYLSKYKNNSESK